MKLCWSELTQEGKVEKYGISSLPYWYILKHTPNSKMKWKMANGLRQKWLLSKCAILMTGAKCSTIILRKMYFNDHIWKLNYILYHLSVLFRFICLTAIVYCALCRDQFLENVMEWNPISHWSIINIFITIATYKMEIAFKPQTKLRNCYRFIYEMPAQNLYADEMRFGCRQKFHFIYL